MLNNSWRIVIGDKYQLKDEFSVKNSLKMKLKLKSSFEDVSVLKISWRMKLV